MRSKIKTVRHLLVAALAAVLSILTGHAATYTWTGAGFLGNQDYLWSNDFNWAGLVAPSPGEANVTLVFPNSNAPKVTTNDLVGLSVSSLQFLGSNYITHGKPAGNTLSLYGPGLGGWAMIASGNGNYFASTSPLNLNNHGFAAVASGCTLSVLSSVSGSGGFTKVSPGTLKFISTSANSYAGTTIVGDGTLELGNGTASPANYQISIAGPLVIGSTNMSYSPLVKLLLPDQIANAQPVTVYENAELWLNGRDDTIGELTLHDGAEVSTGLGGVGTQGLLTLNGNVTCLPSPYADYATLEGRLDLGIFSRTFQIEGELWIVASIAGNSIFNPGITKTGAGVLYFPGAANTYIGPTVVDAGAIKLEGSGTLLGSTGAGTTVNTNGTLVLSGAHIGLEPLTLNGRPGGTCVDYQVLLSNSWAGPITLNGDCTVIGYDVPNFDGALTFSGAISGTGKLRKKGDGDLHFTGLGGNTFTGGMVVEEGTAHFSKSASAPALSGPLELGRANASALNPGVVRIKQINQIPDHLPIKLMDSGDLQGEPGTSDVLGNIDFHGGHLRGQGLTISGNVTNYAAAGDGVLENAVVLSSGTHYFHCAAGTELFVPGTLNGPGAVTKTGGGKLDLRGANNYSGLTWIKEGRVRLREAGRPGGTAAGTVVEPQADLFLWDCSITNETLTLKGKVANNPTLGSTGTNRWKGPVILEADSLIRPSGWLTIDGPISGAGGLLLTTLAGPVAPTLELAGNTANTYQGDTFQDGGILLLNKSGAAAIPGNINVAGDGVAFGTNLSSILRLAQANQLANSSAVNLGLHHWFQLNGHAEIVGSLAGAGNVDLGPANLGVGANGDTTTFAGVINGTGGISKFGTGSFTLTGTNAYTGTTTINGGTLLVMGQQPNSAVSIASGATLGGSGRVGQVTCSNGGIISPGASPGVLEGGVLNFIGTTATLRIEINGTAPSSHDRFKANGSVSFMGGNLHLLMNIPGVVGQPYVIIDNDGADAIGGTFSGLPEGAMLTNNGVVFQISYVGGDGNDVVLVQKNVMTGPQISGITKLGDGTIQITVQGEPNATYSVEATESLTPPVQWTKIGQASANAAGQFTFTDPDAPQHPIRFYRFRLP